MKYAFIQRNQRVWPISVQCRVLRVSVSGYHEHSVRRRDILRRRHLSNEALLVHIRAVYAENRGAYGWRRIWRQLHAQGIGVGKQREQRLCSSTAFEPVASAASGPRPPPADCAQPCGSQLHRGHTQSSMGRRPYRHPDG